jgi:predicted DNA-binding transcriptional regulator YafY
MVYRVKSLQEIMPWLLGWGAAAELLAPERFRREIRQEILKLADLLT